ncbi:hypothetical protein CR513_60209, partial [Mucuna pruriens]
MWCDMKFEGWKFFALKEKLKRCNERLKRWNKEVLGNLDLKIEELVQVINNLDEKAENNTSSENEMELRRMTTTELWHESLLQQKARTRCLKEGDANSVYFHARIRSHRRQPSDKAARIKTMLGSIISPCQTIFLSKRLILDGLVASTKLPIMPKDSRRNFSSSKWILKKLMIWSIGGGFEAVFVMTHAWMLVNGSPTNEFQMSKGLRQGDLLAPFLFLAVV